MLKAVRKRRRRKLSSVRVLAALRRRVHGAHGGAVSFGVAHHEQLSSGARAYFDHMRCRF
jgi:hypothetical protein